MNRISGLSVILMFFLVITACNKTTTLEDPQGNEYKTVTIGDQTWMAENLNYEVEPGSYCYNNDSLMCIVMGRLYTWNAAILAANDIPGWHLPSKKEWEELLEFLGPDSVRYDRIISSETGFSPQWAGVRVFTGDYKAAGLEAVNYWSSSPADSDSLTWSVAIVTKYQAISPHNYPRINACSVRLIKDQ